MSKLEQFKLDLKGMAEGDNAFSFTLDDSFFEAVEAPAVHHGHVDETLTVRRNGDVFDLDFHTSGVVTVQCDRCLDDMDQPIESDYHLVAKFGEDYSEVELAIPLRHVHAPGKCNPAMMKVLEEHSAARSGAGDGEQPVDDRWAALLKIKKSNL